jgi:hypothetical protein
MSHWSSVEVYQKLPFGRFSQLRSPCLNPPVHWPPTAAIGRSADCPVRRRLPEPRHRRHRGRWPEPLDDWPGRCSPGQAGSRPTGRYLRTGCRETRSELKNRLQVVNADETWSRHLLRRMIGDQRFLLQGGWPTACTVDVPPPRISSSSY